MFQFSVDYLILGSFQLIWLLTASFGLYHLELVFPSIFTTDEILSKLLVVQCILAVAASLCGLVVVGFVLHLIVTWKALNCQQKSQDFSNKLYYISTLTWLVVIIVLHFASFYLVSIDFVNTQYQVNVEYWKSINSFNKNNWSHADETRVKYLVQYELSNRCCGYNESRDYHSAANLTIYPSSCCGKSNYLQKFCTDKVVIRGLPACKFSLCLHNSLYMQSSLLLSIIIVDACLLFLHFKAYLIHKFDESILDFHLAQVLQKIKRINITLTDIKTHMAINNSYNFIDETTNNYNLYLALTNEVLQINSLLKQIYAKVKNDPNYRNFMRKDDLLAKLASNADSTQSKIDKLRLKVNDDFLAYFEMANSK